MKCSRATHSRPLVPPPDLETLSRTTAWESHGQKVKLKVMDALTSLSGVQLTTAEIDAVAGLLMLRRHNPGPSRFSPSPSVQDAGIRKPTVSKPVKNQAITTISREGSLANQRVDSREKAVVPPTSQVPDNKSSSQTTSSSCPDPGASQPNTQSQAENSQVPSALSTAPQPYHDSQTSQADKHNVNTDCPQPPVIKKGKHRLQKASQPPRKGRRIPLSTKSTNTTSHETRHTTTSRTYSSWGQTTNQQEAPASLNKPATTRIATTTTTPSVAQHQSQQEQPQPQTQSQSHPQPHAPRSEPPHNSQPLPHSQQAKPTPLFTKPSSSSSEPAPTSTSVPTPVPQEAPKPPATTTTTNNNNNNKKRRKYGTAYEVSRARQIQATGVPRLPGPCHSCARRQRQLDEVAAAAATNAGTVAAGGAGGGLMSGTGSTGTGTGMGRFARRQRGDEFLPCTVLSNGDGDGRNGGGDGNGNREGGGGGGGPTPCARCKSIKMKCEG